MHWQRKFSVLLLEISRLMLFICKWAFGSNTMYKASGGDRIPVESFQILKDDAVKVMHSICQQIWKTHQWPQDWKRSIFIPIPKKGNVKEHSNYHTTALISHVSKVMLKILQAKLQQNMNCELPNVQAGFRKNRGIRGQIANICWFIKNTRDLWLCGSQQTVGSSSRDWNTRPCDLPPEKSVCRLRRSS